ncbi:hypothetical protein SBI_02969 [Streptomyces bingchenggensis BCW-1]|uniref:ABC transporter ATP-binding protein n=1 Tax=Streptomyces bingchenggensis (strain BCW-1) TaxID=749414 RepID=D7C4N9_STRBB|nr:hypothetical protein SBI_02969 [Streptomyces bingchenggensis BCW-1]
METGEPTEALYRLTGWALGRGVALDGITVERPSLEDVCLRLTGRGAPEYVPEYVREAGER